MMDKRSKLINKLRNGSITARELRALLLLSGWELDRTRGSHEFWIHRPKVFVLATHGKDLKHYQVKQAAKFLLVDEE